MRFLKNSLKIVLVMITVIFIIGIVILNKNKFKSIYRSPEYKDIGISVPAGYSIYGIDVSHYQELIDWKKVAKMKINGKRINFAFIKATQGTELIDPYFKNNWKHSISNGIKRGVYHYFNPEEDGNLQAEFFLKNIQLLKGDMNPVVDIEKINNVDDRIMRVQLKNWLVRVQKATNKVPIIYTNPSFYNKYLLGDFDEYPLWVSHYTDADSPSAKRDWQFWQHSEKARINGINGCVDFNVFNGDSTSFSNFFKMQFKEIN